MHMQIIYVKYNPLLPRAHSAQALRPGVGPQVTGRAGYQPNLPSRPREPRRASPRKQSQAFPHQVLRPIWQKLTEPLLCSQGTCREQSKCHSLRPSLWWEKTKQTDAQQARELLRPAGPVVLTTAQNFPAFHWRKGWTTVLTAGSKRKKSVKPFSLKARKGVIHVLLPWRWGNREGRRSTTRA